MRTAGRKPGTAAREGAAAMPDQPTAETPAPRYTVRQGVHSYYRTAVHDAQRLDGPDGAPCCWCHTVADAERIATGLNRDELFRKALRFLIIDEVVGPIERGEVA